MTTIEFNHKLSSLQDYLQMFAYKLTSNDEDAKDLVQETFLKAMTYKDKYVRQNNFKAWVSTIMKNTFINDYRRKKRANTILDSTENHYYLDNSVEERYEQPDAAYAAMELREAVKELNPDYRKAFEMHNDGYKYKEIADELDLNIGTVKSRIFFVRQKLMNKLKEYNQN